MLDYSVPIISGRKVKEENQTLFKKEKKRKKKYYYKYIYICISNCKCVDRLLCCNSVNTLRFALMSMGAVPGICLNHSMDPPPPYQPPRPFLCTPVWPWPPVRTCAVPHTLWFMEFDNLSASTPTQSRRPPAVSACADRGSSDFTAVDHVFLLGSDGPKPEGIKVKV